MAYDQKILPSFPSAILFLWDTSGSMGGKCYVGDQTKAERSATILNRLLANLTIKCAEEKGVRNYFDVAVLEYDGDSVSPAWRGDLSPGKWVPVSKVKENPLRIETQTTEKVDGGQVREVETKLPVWFEPKAAPQDGNKIQRGHHFGYYLVKSWISKHHHSFPPVVINITDGLGIYSLKHIVLFLKELRSLSTDDGSVLVFNIHVSSVEEIAYPSSKNELFLSGAKTLFETSSILPNVLRENLVSEQNIDSDSRGYFYRSDGLEIIDAIGGLLTKQVSSTENHPEGGKFDYEPTSRKPTSHIKEKIGEAFLEWYDESRPAMRARYSLFEKHLNDLLPGADFQRIFRIFREKDAAAIVFAEDARDAVEYWLVCADGRDFLLPQPQPCGFREASKCFETEICSIHPESSSPSEPRVQPAELQFQGGKYKLQEKGELVYDPHWFSPKNMEKAD